MSVEPRQWNYRCLAVRDGGARPILEHRGQLRAQGGGLSPQRRGMRIGQRRHDDLLPQAERTSPGPNFMQRGRGQPQGAAGPPVIHPAREQALEEPDGVGSTPHRGARGTLVCVAHGKNILTTIY